MATIAENLQTILDIKNDIKSAIIAKGVSVADSDGFATYPSKIESIETGEIDFSLIDYTMEDNTNINNKIQANINYSKTLYDNWNPSTTSASFLYSSDNLVYCPNIDTSNVTSMEYMFSNCSLLTYIPLLNTSNVISMENMFEYCSSLTTIPELNTSNVVDMDSMFIGCSALTTIPAIDTSKVKYIAYMFYECTSLQSLPLLDCSNLERISYLFGSSTIRNLTELGGFKNLKIDWNDNEGLYRLPNLTYQSVMNVINNLYDFRGNGDTSTTRTIQFNSSSKALLSDADIAIATNKGWVIS